MNEEHVTKRRIKRQVLDVKFALLLDFVAYAGCSCVLNFILYILEIGCFHFLNKSTPTFMHFK